MTKKSFLILLLVVFLPMLLAFGFFSILEKERMDKKEITSNNKNIITIANKEAKNATIKANLIWIKSAWATIDKTNKNYDVSNFCEDLSVKKNIEEIKRQGVEVVCNSSNNGWALQTRFLDDNQNYVCIDSTSLKNTENSEKLGNSIICPAKE